MEKFQNSIDTMYGLFRLTLIAIVEIATIWVTVETLLPMLPTPIGGIIGGIAFMFTMKVFKKAGIAFE